MPSESALVETQPSVGDAATGAGLRVLIVDDDEVDRLALRRALGRADLGALSIEETDRARTAYERITTERFDCAFFDVRLPDRDGVALLREVRAAGVRTPVVVLTGFGDEQTVVDVMKAGATDYLAKSAVSPERIAQVLRAATRLGAAEAQATAARETQERYAAQLRGLADAAVAMSGAAGVDELLRAAAMHACRVTGATMVRIALATDVAADLGHTGSGTGWMAATGEPAEAPERDARIEWLRLEGRDGQPLGELALAGHPDAGPGNPVLGQLVRLAAGAIENMRLYLAAQRASREREDVLAIVSHDLRNPLHTIALSASFLGEIMPDSVTDAVREQPRIINRAVDRANRLIQDLLDVARLEAGGMPLTLVPVAPRDVLDDTAEAMRPAADAAGVTLECRADGELPDVMADRERLLQIFTNLVGNATRFTPRGGTIVVSAALDTDPSFVRFVVRDTGSGISAENLPHLFDRFWQAQHSARTGAGLGLAIAKGIVESHGGRISVTSEVGVGTEFAFTIPAAH